ncbi:hypothetical protein PM082_003393 [Marasmius tenuissimus]|nr:hypothetical protein PM082_003393 [Marasmius tenuissimus]
MRFASLFSTLSFLVVATGASLVWGTSIGPSELLQREPGLYMETLPDKQQAVFSYAMEVMDAFFKKPLLWDSPRYSAWYAVGLLARNKQEDASTAAAIIEEVLTWQFKDPSEKWYGTFRDDITGPPPGEVWPPRIYGSYDSNMGLFVTSAWIILVEEFSHLLDASLVETIKESMYNATVGDGYRVGGVDGDNLRPIYSNPWYMRVMCATYVGNLSGDKNMSTWGDRWAEEAVTEFNRYDTISEFNSGTYTGVSLWALSLWGYMPMESVIAREASSMIQKTWETIGDIYNPTIKTLGGPFDRTYGMDMRRYFGFLASQISGLAGGLEDNSAPIPLPLYNAEHLGDVAALAILPLTSRFHDPLVPSTVVDSLKTFKGPHLWAAQAVSPPFDQLSAPRNYTGWNDVGINVGAIQLESNVVGGAATSPDNHVPANIFWDSGNSLGWMMLYSTAPSINAVASNTTLAVSFPEPLPDVSRATEMSFRFGGVRRPDFSLPADFMSAVNYTYDLPGLRLTLKEGNVFGEGYTRSFKYGTGTWNDETFYELLWTIPSEGEPPSVVWEFEKI